MSQQVITWAGVEECNPAVPLALANDDDFVLVMKDGKSLSVAKYMLQSGS
jgi:hypothetical protein